MWRVDAQIWLSLLTCTCKHHSIIVFSGINSALKSDSIYENESFVNRIHELYIRHHDKALYTKSFTSPLI